MSITDLKNEINTLLQSPRATPLTGTELATLLKTMADELDEVSEFSSLSALLLNPGKTGKIYVTLDTNFTYRWGGSSYIKINNVDLSTKADLVAGKVPASQLPESVKDVYEYFSLGLFPLVGEKDKIYIALDESVIYRWDINDYSYVKMPDTNFTTKADLVAGKVPASQLPSYVDDVLEFATLAALPPTGESVKIYITLNTNFTYRWSGSAYVLLNSASGTFAGLTDAPTQNTALATLLAAKQDRPNQLLSGCAITPNYTTVVAAGTWLINGITYGKTTPSSFPGLTLCATGMLKTLAFYGETNNTITLITSEQLPVFTAPTTLRANSALLRWLVITDTTFQMQVVVPDSFALKADLGNTTNLLTATKTNLVAATNELYLALQILNVTYAQLVALIAASTLEVGRKYRITDYQTIHTIPNTTVLNTSVLNIPVVIEPLVVVAATVNKLQREAHSELWVNDIIHYSVNNLSGSLKGIITYRHDTVQNVSFPNDFRYVVYRRWKLNPPVFDASIAYPRYAPVIHNNALYYVCKLGGFAAGAATAPTAQQVMTG